MANLPLYGEIPDLSDLNDLVQKLNSRYPNGTIPTSFGGTGLTTIGTPKQVLAVNAAGTALNYVTPVVTYGSMYYDNASTALPLTTTTAGTYYTVASNGTQNLSAGSVNGITANVASGNGSLTLAAGSAGEYEIAYNLSYSSSANNVTYQGYIAINGVNYAQITSETKVTQASTVLTSGAKGQATLNDGDVITFRVTSDTNGAVASLYKFNLHMTHLGLSS